MNKPTRPLTPDPDIGALDELGQEIWTASFARDMERVRRDPAYQTAIDEALASADRGEEHSHDEMLAISAAARRQWYADRELPAPAERAA